MVIFLWQRNLYLHLMSLSKKQKGKWTGVKGVLTSREWWENIFLSGYEEYSNTLVCEQLANVTHICYLMGPIDIWVCELWSVVHQLQISERLWRTWQDDLSPHRWVLFSLSLRYASPGQQHYLHQQQIFHTFPVVESMLAGFQLKMAKN